MCAGVLGATVDHLYLRMSPGFCNANHGAVEAQDWRDYRIVGQSTGTDQGLRFQRDAAIFNVSSMFLVVLVFVLCSNMFIGVCAVHCSLLGQM